MEDFLRILLSIKFNKVDIFALTKTNLKPNYERGGKEIIQSDIIGDAISIYINTQMIVYVICSYIHLV